MFIFSVPCVGFAHNSCRISSENKTLLSRAFDVSTGTGTVYRYVPVCFAENVYRYRYIYRVFAECSGHLFRLCLTCFKSRLHLTFFIFLVPVPVPDIHLSCTLYLNVYIYTIEICTCSCRKWAEALSAQRKLAPTGAEVPYLLMAARISEPSVASPSVLVTLMLPSAILREMGKKKLNPLNYLFWSLWCWPSIIGLARKNRYQG